MKFIFKIEEWKFTIEIGIHKWSGYYNFYFNKTFTSITWGWFSFKMNNFKRLADKEKELRATQEVV